MTPAITADSPTAAAEPSLGVTVPAESLPAETPRAPCPAEVIRNHRAILEMTAELFPGETIEVEEAVDPETAGDPYLVVMVATHDNVPVVVGKHHDWHVRIWEAAPRTADAYRLLLDVQ